MAIPRTPNQKKRYASLNKRLAKYVSLVQSIYDQMALEAASIVTTTTNYDGGRPFRFGDYPSTRSRVNDLMRFYSHDLQALVYSGTTEEWKQSNLVQDLLANDVLKVYGIRRDGERVKKYYQPNNDALKAFQRRKDKGMTVSQKIWNQSYNFKKELEYAISSAIEKGQSAITLSKRISKYLHDFPSLQKDYKERFGEATDCHDCEYRSIRLARSEINMAYREAEQLRWQQMDFIKGYEIKLSHSHPKHDVCDELAGVYPKWFKWTGWHPNDLCYVVPIVMTDDEWYNGKGQEITDMPDSFKLWIARNENRIYEACQKETEPYWIKDNQSIISTNDTIKGSSVKDFLLSTKNHLMIKEDARAEQEATPFSALQEENHRVVSEALGVERGYRMSFKKADSGKTNPNFSWMERVLSLDQSAYNINCTMTTFAHELRMRGWDIEAKGMDIYDSKLKSILLGNTETLWIDPETKRTPKFQYCSCKDGSELIPRLLERTKTGRYHMLFNYKDGGGHVICVDKLPNGSLRFYDPQDNTLDITSWFKDVNYKKGFRLLKVDGLLINPDYARLIVRPRN